MTRARGFTLLEMLVVLAIIAIASLLAVAALGGGMRGLQQRAAARELAAQMRFTRAVAISSGRAQDFILDPHARSWRGAKGRSGRLPGEGGIVFTGARASQFADQRDGADADAGKGTVRFFPDGAATGGRIRLLANGAGWDIDVAWLTGDVRLHRTQDAR